MKSKIAFQTGVTLLEAITVVVLSSIIVMLTVTLFLSQQKGYVKDEANATIQENGHQALEALVVKLRQTGYMLPDTFKKLEPYNSVGSSTSPAPDSVAVWGNFSNFTTNFWYTATQGNNWVILYYKPDFDFSPMMWLWLRYRDGSKSEVHRCENYSVITFMSKTLLIIWFPSGDVIGNTYPAESTYVIASTFVREMYKIQTPEAGHPTLMIYRNYQPGGLEFVRDIEDMQLTYKLANGSIISNPGTSDIKNIVEINVAITARAPTPDPAYKDPVRGDRYRRKTFTSSVKPYNLSTF